MQLMRYNSLMFSIDDFDYSYPEELIAHQPVEPRDSCKLLVVDRESGEIQHKIFSDLVNILDQNCVIVRNNTKVLPARLLGRKDTGGKAEVLLVRQLNSPTPERTTRWECLTKPGLKENQQVFFEDPITKNVVLTGKCLEITEDLKYTRNVEFDCPEDLFYSKIFTIGHTPLPPYITATFAEEEEIRQKYQTSFAQTFGSVAAPTAGLHFTPELDQRLRKKGIEIVEVTLHVGLGTFLPVQPEQIAEKRLHQEVFVLSPETARVITAAKAAGKKIISVGTTTTRVLESCVKDGQLLAQSGTTELFIQPGDAFQIVDGLITNFHVPKSSLLMLVSTLTTVPNTSHPFTRFSESPVGRAYQEAINQRYRLFSFGDAMLIR